MQIFQKRWFIRVLFLAVVVALAVSFTAVAQAEGKDTSSAVQSDPEPVHELANCITGQVWYDGNRDGRKRDRHNEDFMDGASVTLLGVGPFENQPGPYRLVSHQITGPDGYYSFCELEPGTYELRVKPVEGDFNGQLYLTTGNSLVQITLEKDDYAVVDVGYYPPNPLCCAYLNDPMRTKP